LIEGDFAAAVPKGPYRTPAGWVGSVPPVVTVGTRPATPPPLAAVLLVIVEVIINKFPGAPTIGAPA